MTREEAIERIKSRYDKWALDDKDLEAIQCAFPELKESKDEKIRDAIKLAVSQYISAEYCYVSDIQKGEIITWLEKQKEQKPIDIDFISDWLRKHIKTYVNSEYNEFHKTVEYDGSINIERLIEDLKKAIEQQPFVRENDFVSKPAEWSEEDERNLTDAISAIEHLKNDCDWGYLGVGNDIDNVLNFLGSLPQRFNLQPK